MQQPDLRLRTMQVRRICYRTLVVSEDASLRFLYERVVEMRDQGYREDRADWLAKFQQHLIAAEKVHQRVSFFTASWSGANLHASGSWIMGASKNRSCHAPHLSQLANPFGLSAVNAPL